MAGIVIDKLSKTFASGHGQAVPALREFSLEIGAGELVVLVGPSGSGKTTLLRIIAGLEEASGGHVWIDGQMVDSLPPHQREVALAFQEHSLYPHMTAGKNLSFGLKLRHVPAQTLQERTREVAELLGLNALLERMPSTLSGGERQRVALGRALIIEPKVLLLDEPLSNLDGPLRSQMRREIARIHRSFSGSILYVTHDQHEAMTLADRVAVLRDGILQQVARPLEIYNRPANRFVAGFFGAPPMNFVAGRLERNGPELWFSSEVNGRTGMDPLRFPVSTQQASALAGRIGAEIVAGFRPEHVSLQTPAPALPGDRAGVRAVVEWVEPVGPELHLHLKAQDLSLVARAPARFPVERGADLTLCLDVPEVLFFEADSGLALKPPATASTGS